MKRIWNCLLVFLSVNCFGQVNLVPNPSFEIYDTCPYTTAQVPFALGWDNYGDTPDYFNSCATNYMSVPSNAFGYQYAEDGNAYCGLQFINYADTTYREFIGTTLNSPLQIGQTYYVSAYFNLSDIGSSAIAVNKLCIRFSNVIYSQNSPPALDNFAQVVADTIITDTTGWYQLKRSFIADSAYTQIIIGNFFGGYLTDTLSLYGISVSSIGYYMVDVVCVSTDSNTCYASGTGIQNVYDNSGQLEIKCMDDYILLSNNASKTMDAGVSITDLSGRRVFTQQLLINKTLRIPIQHLSPSIYFLTIQTKNKRQTVKFIKK